MEKGFFVARKLEKKTNETESKSFHFDVLRGESTKGNLVGTQLDDHKHT